MIYVLNFATEDYEKVRHLNTRTAYKYGADKVFEYTLDDIDEEFYNKNKAILDQKRGCGYWLWKPYFIYSTLLQANENDWIVYADSAMYFRKSIIGYIAELEKQGVDFIARENKFIEKAYNKRDVIVEMGCDSPRYTDTNQRAAGAIIVKNTPRNRSIINEWLEGAQNIHWISDEPSVGELPNYPEFIDHRHDQSIFSLVCKKNNVACNSNLVMDVLFFDKRNALMVFHHTKAGNVVMAFLLSIPRGIKMVWGDIKGKVGK